MAVIREKLQFQIGKIGVARASESGRITGQAISQGANQLSAMFYKKEAAAAEKAGAKAGASADPQEVITINPETGEPEAYAPPIGMGTIGADAYQRIVMGRFQQSMEDEIKNKGKELAAKYDGNSNGAALYETAMSNYLASMTNVAQDEFKGFIADVGKVYLNSTKTNMSIRQIGRERAAAKKAHIASIEQSNNDLRGMVATFGSKALEGDGPAVEVVDGVTESIDLGTASQLLSPAEGQVYTSKQRMAIALGLVEHVANNSDDSHELTILNASIGEQNLEGIENPYLAEIYKSFGNDYKALAAFEKGANGILQDSIVRAKANEGKQAEELAKQASVDLLNLELGDDSAKDEMTVLGGAAPSGTVASVYINKYFQIQNKIKGAAASGDKEMFDALGRRQDAITTAFVDSLSNKALSGLTPDQTDKFEAALVSGDAKLVPKSALPAYYAMQRVQADTGEDILGEFKSTIAEYRKSPAKFYLKQKQDEALLKASQEIDPKSVLLSTDVVSSVEKQLKILSGIPNLPKASVESFKKEILQNASRNYINRFFNNPTLTADQLNKSLYVLMGTSVSDVFSETQVKNLKSIRTYMLQFGGEDEILSVFTKLKAQTLANLKIEEDREKAKNDKLEKLYEAGEKSGAMSHLRRFFSELNPTAKQLNQALFVLSGTYTDGDLTPDQVATLEEVRTAMENSGDPSGITATFTKLKTQTLTNLTEEKNIEDLRIKNAKDAMKQKILKAEKNMKKVSDATARDYLNSFFRDKELTIEQLNQALFVLDGTSESDILTKDQVANLRDAKRNMFNAGTPDKIVTIFQRLKSQKLTNLTAAAAKREELLAQKQVDIDIDNGSADPKKESNRVRFEKMLSDRINGGKDISSLLRQRTPENAEKVNLIMASIKDSGIIPQSLVLDIQAVARGEFRFGMSAAVTVDHYRKLYQYISQDGQIVQNSAMQVFSVEEAMIMNHLAAYTDIQGNLNEKEIVRVVELIKSNKEEGSNFQSQVTEMLGGTVQDFVAKRVGSSVAPQLPRSSRKALAVFTLDMIKAGTGLRTIKKAIKDQINQTYADGGGEVRNQDGGKYTMAALSITAQGFETQFKEAVLEKVALETDLESVSLGGGLIVGKGGMPSIMGTGSLAATSSDKTVGMVEAENNIYLMPIRRNAREVTYLVFRASESLTGGDEIVYTKGDNPQPLTISTRDETFLRNKQEVIDARNAKIDAAIAEEKRQTEIDSAEGLAMETHTNILGNNILGSRVD